MEAHEVKWSYSSLKDYQNCPRQYQEIKVLKNYTKFPTAEMRYGTEVHKAVEDYVGEGKPLAPDYQRFTKQLQPLIEMEGVKHPELRMALGFDRKPSKWGDYWVRGIADLVVLNGDTAFIVDYKTGSSKYPDPKQLQLMALMVFSHYPEIVHIKAGLLFVIHEHFFPSEYHKEDEEKLWGDFYPHLERLRLSYENGVWQENPTPLCGWCPVKRCQFHKEK